jgi:hypothetical protein
MSDQLTDIFAIVVADESGADTVLRRETEVGTQPMIADTIDRLRPFFATADQVCAARKWEWNIVRFKRVGYVGRVFVTGGDVNIARDDGGDERSAGVTV